MEFLEHDLKTLQEDMAEPFLPSEIKTLLLQLSSAVEYLHDHWILHVGLEELQLRSKAKPFHSEISRHRTCVRVSGIDPVAGG